MEYLIEYMARGFMTMLMISMPCVLVAAGVGLVVGILQAVTQVQEQTIAAAPKILAVFLTIIIGGYGFVRLLTNLTTEGYALAFNVVPKNESYVLPSDYYKYTMPFAGSVKDIIKDKSNLNELMENASRSDFSKLKNEKMQYISPPKRESSGPDMVEKAALKKGK